MGGASCCTMRLGNARSAVQPGKSLLGLCCGRAHLTSPALTAVGGRVFPRKLGGRVRACACGHVAAPDPLRRGVCSLPLRGPDSIWGPGPRGRSGAPGCFGTALPSPRHVVTPDPSPSGKRVRDSWSGVVEVDPRGPVVRLLRAELQITTRVLT